MNENQIQSKCKHCPMNRRGFLKAGCAAGIGMLGANSVVAQDNKKQRIRVIYSLHTEVQARPDWPNIGFNFKPVMQRIDSELKKNFPDIEFISTMANGEEQAKAILESDRTKHIDGYIVYQMNCWNRVVQTMATSNKPVLYVDFQYGGSGGFLVYTAKFIRDKTPNLGFVASSDMNDVIEAVQCFRLLKQGGSANEFAKSVKNKRIAATPKPGNLSCLDDPLNLLPIEECAKRLKQSKILAVRNQESGPGGEMFGIPVERVSFAEVNEAWKNAEKDQSREVAQQWIDNAAAVIDVPEKTIHNSAAMYIGMKNVLKKHNANAITINCLGGFYGGHIHAYPCLGFHELNNEALVGACECDVRSTASMLIVNTLTQGRPGYISDPVIDTSKRQIIYAHCVAPKKMFGPDGSTCEYKIMNHSEDRQGASVRSILPLGYMTTTIDVLPQNKEIIMHQGKAIENDPDDRACRTKLAVEPIGDIEKLFTMWDQWSWHRVTSYGDLKEPIYALADQVGWKVIEEA
jgi:hypothetical protein